MPTKLSDIMSLRDCAPLRLIAGENGLRREVKGTTISSSVDLIPYANEGDLDFVRGSDIHSPDEAIEYVKAAFAFNMAGIVFVLFDDFTEIPEDVICFASSHDFPVFTIPWENVKISTMARAIAEKIMRDSISSKPSADVLKSILIGQENLFTLSDSSISQLKRIGFDMHGAFRVLHFIITGDSEKIYNATCHLYRELEFLSINKGTTISLMPDKVALILNGVTAQMKDKSTARILNDAMLSVKRLFPVSIYCGIGTLYHDLKDIERSYQEALYMSWISGSRLWNTRTKTNFEDSGIFKSIYENPDRDNLLKYSEEKVGALKVYDKANHSDLTEFLIEYIKHSGRNGDLSATLHLHRNTVLYKIRKIEDILSCDLSDYSDLFAIYYALCIMESIMI